jgi:putative endonuclease
LTVTGPGVRIPSSPPRQIPFNQKLRGILILNHMYYVYILKSEKDASYYKGVSENPLLRLYFHNEGKSTYTSKKTPWVLVAIFEFELKTDALAREKKIKKYPTKSLIALIESKKNILVQYLSSPENC